MASTTENKAIYFGLAAVVAAISAYAFLRSEFSPLAKSRNTTAHRHRKHHFHPKGDPHEWSEEDMRKYLTSRGLSVGHDPSIDELRAMVFSKLHDPNKPKGLDDPRDWTEEQMRDYLKANNLEHGDASRADLLAMVESKMHEPK